MKYVSYCFLLLNSGLFSSPVSVPDGGTGNTALTAYAIICGGTQNFDPLQSVASVGSAGQPLVSNGAGSLPSFQTLPVSGGGTNATSISAGVVQSNGTTLSSLGIGSDGQVLENISGVVSWSFQGLLQVVIASTTARISTTGTSIPNDNTIPQDTEGTLILSASITPKSATSTLFIYFSTSGTPSASPPPSAVMALFVNSSADALAAQFITSRSSGSSVNGVLQYTTTSGSTSARTYSVRVGSADFQVNAGTVSRKFGGVASTYLVILEIA